MVALLEVLAVTSPIWIMLLRHFALARVARLGLAVMAVCAGLTFSSMVFLGAVCAPAQDLTYGPAQCPSLPVPLINALVFPMLFGIITFVIWAPALLALVLLTEGHARYTAQKRNAEKSGDAAPSLSPDAPKD